MPHSLDRTGAAERRLRKRVIVWTVAAAASLVLVAVYGLPALADRLAPLIPFPVEQRFGGVMDAQVRAMLDDGKSGQAVRMRRSGRRKRPAAPRSTS